MFPVYGYPVYGYPTDYWPSSPIGAAVDVIEAESTINALTVATLTPVSVDAIEAASTVHECSASAVADVTVGLITSASSIYAPTVIEGNDLLVPVDCIASVATVHHTIFTAHGKIYLSGAAIRPVQITPIYTASRPSMAFAARLDIESQVASVGSIAAESTMQDPSITINIDTSAPVGLIQVTSSVKAISFSTQVELETIAAESTVHDLGFNVGVTLDCITATSSVKTPTVSYATVVSLDSIGAASTMQTPTVTTITNIYAYPDRIACGSTMRTPTVEIGDYQ